MRSAVYGRMRIGRCVEAGLGFLGCSADVLRLADAKCSERQSCDIAIPDKDFDATRPCYKELKVYLEASYICMRGQYLLIVYVYNFNLFNTLRGKAVCPTYIIRWPQKCTTGLQPLFMC